MKKYLGDGVYVEKAGDQLRLTTEDGISVTNEIYLEADVLSHLVEFAKRVENIGQKSNG